MMRLPESEMEDIILRLSRHAASTRLMAIRRGACRQPSRNGGAGTRDVNFMCQSRLSDCVFMRPSHNFLLECTLLAPWAHYMPRRELSPIRFAQCPAGEVVAMIVKP
jgi:hypothetical protein